MIFASKKSNSDIWFVYFVHEMNLCVLSNNKFLEKQHCIYHIWLVYFDCALMRYVFSHFFCLYFTSVMFILFKNWFYMYFQIIVSKKSNVTFDWFILFMNWIYMCSQISNDICLVFLRKATVHMSHLIGLIWSWTEFICARK